MRMLFWLVLLVLSLSGCTISDKEPQTFVISELTIPTNDYGSDFLESSRDIDLDGEFDNSLPGWVNASRLLNLNLQKELDNQISSGKYLFGIEFLRHPKPDEYFVMFRATSAELPRFDGNDQIFSTGQEFSFSEFTFEYSTQINAKGAVLEWLLFPFGVGDIITVPLQDARVLSSFYEEPGILQGNITGYVDVLDAARLMEQVPDVFDAVLASDALNFGGGTSINCEAGDDGLSATCQAISLESFCSDRILDNNLTGFCVGHDSASKQLLKAMDGNHDGHYSVDFDEVSGHFVENELSLIFTYDGEGTSPDGIIGRLFTLDLDGVDGREAMPIGVQFTAVRANQ
jgi:hypothetical protein